MFTVALFIVVKTLQQPQWLPQMNKLSTINILKNEAPGHGASWNKPKQIPISKISLKTPYIIYYNCVIL